jgi:monoterpene epsilon-lactone hydrolase
MPSQAHEAIVAMLQAQPVPENLPSPAELRAMFEMMAAAFPVPEGAVGESVDADGVPAEWITMPGSRGDRVVLYLHGGGYVIGSINTHRSLVARLARDAEARCLAIDYRLAPEHPFPAAIEDATAAYRWLLSRGVAPSRILVAGDSAGGGLTLATLLSLRDAGDPLPAAAICLSPWTDLEGTGDSATEAGVDDPMINLPGLQAMGRLYAGATHLRSPLAAPLHADLAGLPPLLIFVGTREVLRDDSLRVVDKARAAGVAVELVVGEGLVHVWPMFGDQVPEAAEAVARMGAFTKKNLP